jgi:predicted O-methyltransferase YrrM
MATTAEKLEKIKAAIRFENFLAAPRIDALAQAAFLRPNPKLEHALMNSAAKGLPPISVLPLAGQHLRIMAQAMGAKSVLEIGTLGGYSAICFAEAGASVTSIEIDPKHADVAIENTQGLDVEVLLGAALEVLPKLATQGKKFDMVFIDADFEDEWEHFDWAVKLTRPNGCIILDDVVAALILKGQHEEDYTGETFMTRIGRDERVTATLVPLAVSHSMSPKPIFNGYIMATVKPQ